MTATIIEPKIDADSWLAVRADVIEKYLCVPSKRQYVVNMELFVTRCSQELLDGLLLAFHRSTSSIEELVEMLGYVRALRRIIAAGF